MTMPTYEEGVESMIYARALHLVNEAKDLGMDIPLEECREQARKEQKANPELFEPDYL